ncbi:inactive ubiquitin carboxyl-terminal hydrolase MINDY-4B [Sorex fumeus]|uniref:inactive ubiquitin carboxyl-terminal hydrolase MINDY-4B n=1 Tax=Sorex fumeus TaxID=62283 RepID=UPI0024AE87CB|nr:inactive ubiquitin carboxyl-terminal hydrolase MINDY-4B [Sorex fumeus]
MDREVPAQALSSPGLDLEQIRREIALLDQWKDIFSHPGLGTSNAALQKLRQSLLGSSLGAFSADWEQACFRFQRPASALAFALQVGKGGARSVQMAVQGFIVKHLLFPAQGTVPSPGSLSALGPLEQGRGLAAALTTILWAAGAARRATVCLVTPTASHSGDDVIERLRLFELSEREATEQFIYDHLPCFEAEGSRGVVLFLCSLVLSRTLESLQTDLDSSTPHLLRPHAGSFLCRQAAVNLLLTGRASPQVFNGRQEGPSGDMLQGVQGRSEVGYLQSGKDLSEDHRPSQVGSMLQTPRFPIWLCNLSGSHSVLFSTNRQLVADWKAERVFGLHFFDGHLAHLTVDTHAHPWESTRREEERRPGRRCSLLEMAIRTKWSEASVHWAGPAPSV